MKRSIKQEKIFFVIALSLGLGYAFEIGIFPIFISLCIWICIMAYNEKNYWQINIFHVFIILQMNKNQYSYCSQKLEFIIDSLDFIKGDIEKYGGFQTETLEEEFWTNIESAVISIQECMENLEADEAVSILKKS